MRRRPRRPRERLAPLLRMLQDQHEEAVVDCLLRGFLGRRLVTD